MSMTDPTKWTGNWGSRVSASGQKWTTNLNAVASTIPAKAAAAVNIWQQAVSSPAAASAFTTGVQNMNLQQFQASVAGAGQTKYTSSGTTKQAKYAAFAASAGSKWPGMLNSLPARGARGSTANQQRMIQWSTQLTASRGTY